MNLAKIKQTLKKVGALVENMDEHGSTSAIEKDLLLRYLRDLYEEVGSDAPAFVQEEEESVPSAEAVAPAMTHEPAHVVPEPVHQEEAQTTFVDDTSTGEKVEINKFENPVKYYPPGQEEVTEQVVEAPVAEAVAHVVSQVQTNDGRFESVFITKSSTDLADKLQLQPVTSIEGAMGINQRMLVINELFGGDHNLFMETVTHLDGLTDFDSAKSYLIDNLAGKYEWDGDEKVTKAADFVQLVRRKFA